MVTGTDDTLYKEVVKVTHKYFGPAADRFVTRQIRNHLSKNPEQLRKQDLARLIDWIRLAMALLNEDEKLVNMYAADLKALTRSNKKMTSAG
jgi:hypothetical protein